MYSVHTWKFVLFWIFLLVANRKIIWNPRNCQSHRWEISRGKWNKTKLVKKKKGYKPLYVNVSRCWCRIYKDDKAAKPPLSHSRFISRPRTPPKSVSNFTEIFWNLARYRKVRGKKKKQQPCPSFGFQLQRQTCFLSTVFTDPVTHALKSELANFQKHLEKWRSVYANSGAANVRAGRIECEQCFMLFRRWGFVRKYVLPGVGWDWEIVLNIL